MKQASPPQPMSIFNVAPCASALPAACSPALTFSPNVAPWACLATVTFIEMRFGIEPLMPLMPLAALAGNASASATTPIGRNAFMSPPGSA